MHIFVHWFIAAHTCSPSDYDAYKSATIVMSVIASIAIVIIILAIVCIVMRTPTNSLYIVLTNFHNSVLYM